jgi:hypothetical protein
MSNPVHIDPLTDSPRTPDELRRLNLEQARGGAMWPWIIGVIAIIFVLTLMYGYKLPSSRTTGAPPPSSSPITTGLSPAAAPAPPEINPLAASPTGAPETTAPTSPAPR